MCIFILIMCAAILCLSFQVFLLSRARDQQGRLGGGESGADVARLQASIDELTSQVHLLGEEKEFYRELKAPQDTPRDGSDSEVEPG